MAQLIKLSDYISRYEWDTYRYPTQFIRMKRDSWDRLYNNWSNDVTASFSAEDLKLEERTEEVGFFAKLKDKWKKTNVHIETIQDEMEEPDELPETEDELKQYFLDHMFKFQMKWATSTVLRQSIVAEEYYRDPLLKYLLQRFPDTYLVMYHPIFSIKQAPFEADILLISPLEIEIIQFVEMEEHAVIMAGEERVWHVESPRGGRKILNPIISLKRTGKLLESILASQGVEFSIKKTVLSRTNPIIFATEPYQMRLIGKDFYPDWFKEKRSLRSPLKGTQIKAAETLLKFCQSTSIKRPEWEEDFEDDFGQMEMEEN